MTGNSALNLSLLSRGVGEVSRNGHEKVEVVFEPEDYFNWVNHPKRMYLPPLRHQDGLPERSAQEFSYFKGDKRAQLPKTFTTRKGALLLFSEELATKTNSRQAQERKRRLVTHSMDDFDLRTVDDLAKSILSYGKDDERDGIYLGFVHPRRLFRETRRIRPGFSAKRYLSTWTHSWDDSLLHKLLDKGYMSEDSIQQFSSFIPNKRLRLYDDLSNCPAPYRLLRTMLLSPGSLSGYTFYRLRPQSEQSIISDIEEKSTVPTADAPSKAAVKIPQQQVPGKIKVVQSKHGVLKEVEYNELERNKQEEVLTELLVKSAIHHALKKQQEYMEESFPEDVHAGRGSEMEESTGSQEGGQRKTSLPDFDMKEAVESLLDAKKGTSLLDGSILNTKGAKTLSASGGSLKGSSLPQYSARSFEAPRGRPYSNEVPPDGHFPRSFDSSSTGSNRSGKLLQQQQQQASQQLPPIIDEGGDISSPYTVLPPIADAADVILEAKEEAKLDVPLVNIEPPTPQHSTLTNLPQSMRGGPSREPTIPPASESTHEVEEDGSQWGVGVTEILEQDKEASTGKQQSQKDLVSSGATGQKEPSSPRSKGPVLAAGSHLHSSRESLAESNTGSQVHLPGTLPGWKGSQPSLKSGATLSKKGASSHQGSGSYKGSVIYGPDGEAINVGGAVGLPDSPVPVFDMNKLLDGAESAVSEDSGHLSDDEGGESFRSSAPEPPSQSWGAGSEGYKQLQQKRDTEVRSGDLDAQMSIHSWSYTPKDDELGQRSPHTQRSYSQSTDDSSVDGDVFDETHNSDSGTGSIKNANPSDQLNSTQNSSRPGSKGTRTSSAKPNSARTQNDRYSVPSVHTQTPRSSLRTSSALTSFPIQEETEEELTEAEGEREVTLEGDDFTDGIGESGSVSEAMSLHSGKKSGKSLKSHHSVNGIPPLEKCSSPTNQNIVINDAIDQAVDQLFEPIAEPDTARSRQSSDKGSTLAEQGLIDALTEHAQKIAASVLKHGDAGVNLAEDIKTAAAMWMDRHPHNVLSRSQSVQELPDTTAAEEIARSQKRKSADPTVAEYKELIRRTLSSAVAKQMGIEDGVLPDDTEISQEVMEALTNKSLTPDELEVVRTGSGRSIIRARSSTSSPLKEGHLYQPAPGKHASHSSSAKSSKPPISIPNDRQTTADLGELDVVNLGLAEAQDQEGGLSGTISADRSPVHSARSRKLSDQLSVAPGDGKPPSGKRSQGSGSSRSSDELKEAKTPDQELADIMKELHVDSPSAKTPSSGKKSKSSLKSFNKTPRNSLEGRDEFVVGKVEDKKELEKLYAPLEPPPPKKTPKPEGKPKSKKKSPVKTGKKAKKKDKKSDVGSVSSQEVADVVVVLGDKTSTPVLPDSLPGDSLEDSESKFGSELHSPAPSKSESDDFVFVRDSDTPSEPDIPKSATVKSAVPSPATLDVTDNEADISDSSSNQAHTISNKDARAAKRAAQAEKRRQEVERKRREREEQLKKEKEEQERQEMLNRELEETRRRKAEERRLRKQQEEEEMNREAEAEMDRARRAQQELEREKRMKEEYQRKLEEMKRKQAELDQKRHEEMLIRQKEEEERRLEEERMMYEMAEHERIAYEKKKKEDAERRKREEEAARIRREEEAARALEEARRLAEEMARKQAELEARLKFNRELMLEAKGLGHTQDITRAFVYSYFELLQWLGLDIPEFDLQKLQAKF